MSWCSVIFRILSIRFQQGCRGCGLACSLCGLALTVQTARGQTELDDFRLSMNVRRVALSVAVRDQKGAAVLDLQKSDFAVYEDGKLQELRDFRKEEAQSVVGLIIDNSGSMMLRTKEVTQAAEAFIAAVVPKSEVFVLHFNTQVRLGLPVGVPFSKNQTMLNTAVETFRPTGFTAMYDALYQGIKHSEESPALKKVLVVLSDGGDNRSMFLLGRVTRLADIAGAVVYGIGIRTKGDTNWNPGSLRSLAGRTGGEVYFPKRLVDIQDAYELVARDLREQYTLIYSPEHRASKNGFHKIRVEVRHPDGRKLTVRTRAGYYDKPDSPALTMQAKSAK